MAKQLAVSVGDEVRVVLASKEAIPAKVIGIGTKPNHLDIQFVFHGELQTITSSPFDPTKSQPDSWHLPNT